MSESANGVFQPSPEGERARRRQYRITAKLLREFTSRLYRIAHHLGEYIDGRVAPGEGGYAPWSVLTAANRYEAIAEEVKLLALHASQMLVHYQLDEAEAAELRLRLPDAEYAVSHVREMLNRLAELGRDSAHKSSADHKAGKHTRPRLTSKS